MKLNITERISLFDLLPKEGHFADLITLRKAREIFALTEQEIIDLQYREEETQNGRMAYFDVNKAAEEKDLPVDEWTTRTIQKALAKIEKDGKLSEKLMSLYMKFVINNE
jgi:predicted transcriptional regulator